MCVGRVMFAKKLKLGVNSEMDPMLLLLGLVSWVTVDELEDALLATSYCYKTLFFCDTFH